LGFLISSRQLIEPLACPARFKRATYALEAVKMRLNNTKNNAIKVLAFDVAYTPRLVALGGAGVAFTGDWMVRYLICRLSLHLYNLDK
jgi:hypothetical protein